jgi:hypothetical protein
VLKSTNAFRFRELFLHLESRELLEDHVKQISIRSAGQKRAESAVIEEEYHEGIHVNPHREEPHQDEYGPSHDELTMRQRIHHQK